MIALQWVAIANAGDGIGMLGGGRAAPFGFVDIGWFDAGGTGNAFRTDLGGTGAAWVYEGDPWSSAINSQGDPADLVDDADERVWYDRVSSEGRPTFLVNAVELGLQVDQGSTSGCAPRCGPSRRTARTARSAIRCRSIKPASSGTASWGTGRSR